MEYFVKMKGTTKSPPPVGANEMAWSWIGSFLGIAAVGYINFSVLTGTDLIMMIGSFGASAVLIYGAIKSPLAQPRNLVGVAAYKIFPGVPWLAAAVAVSTAIALMHATKTLHPPGGATALIAVIGGPKIHDLGFFYAVIPVGAGVGVMLLIALAVNNIPKSRRYPEFWI